MRDPDLLLFLFLRKNWEDGGVGGGGAGLELHVQLLSLLPATLLTNPRGLHFP